VEEQIPLPSGVAPAIVSVDVWNAVQVRLATNKGEHTRNKAKGRQYLLRGLVFCAVCERRMYPEPGKGQLCYRCSSRSRPSGKCGALQAPANDLEAWVWEHIATVLRDPSIITGEVEKRRAAGPDPVLTGALETAQGRLTKIEKKQQRLIARFSAADGDEDDAFPGELIEREIATLEREKRQLHTTIAEIEARLAQQEQTIAQLDALNTYCERVGRNLDSFSFDDKRLALEAMGVRVVANGREWELHGSIPTADEGGVMYQTSAHYVNRQQPLPAHDARAPAP
jgi:site-specific DNA recombinase